MRNVDAIAYDILAKSEALIDVHGGRAYPIRAPQHIASPYLVFNKISATDLNKPVRGRCGLRQVEYQADLYAGTLDELIALQDAVFDAVDDADLNGEQNGVLSCSAEVQGSEFSDAGDDLYRVVMRVFIIHN